MQTKHDHHPSSSFESVNYQTSFRLYTSKHIRKAMEVSYSPPSADSFTPLSVHQSQTPESFFSGPPVLYHHSPSTTLLINTDDLESAPALVELTGGVQSRTNGTAGHVNGDSDAEEAGQELSIPNIDVWITSESVHQSLPTLASLTTSQAISPILQLQERPRLNIVPLHLPPRCPGPLRFPPSITFPTAPDARTNIR